MQRSVTALVVVTWLASEGLTHAQVVTGTIIGRVHDEQQSVMPGATATITSTALPAGPRVVVTNENGEYRFVDLAPGTYSLTVEVSGFATYQETDLRVIVGGTIERNVTMRVSAVEETVTVSGQSPMVDPRQVGVESVLQAELIEAIPGAHQYIQNYFHMVPGVTGSSTNTYLINVMGSSVNESSYIFDGVLSNNPSTGRSEYWGAMEGTQEIQVSTLGASAEYAIAQGGVFNIVTKDGTNVFKGSVMGSWYPDSLTSKPIRRPCNCPFGETGRTIDHYYDYQAYVGGPMLRDKLWFYGGVTIDNSTQYSPGSNPNPPPPKPYYHDYRPLAKVMWQASNTTRIKGSYWDEFWDSRGAGSFASPPETVLRRKGSNHSYAGEVTTALSDSTYILGRVSAAMKPDDFVGSSVDCNTCPRHVDLVTGINSGGVTDYNRLQIARYAQSLKVNRFVRTAHGEHDLRGGVQLDQASYTVRGTLPGGVRYQDLNGAPNQAIYRDPYVQGARYSWQGFWIEDQLSVKRLSVTMGIRYDRMHATSPDVEAVDIDLNGIGQTVKGLGDMFTWSVWSPRLGFNLKLTSSGKTTVRGTYGRAHRAIILSDWADVHPGLSPIITNGFDPATGGYTRLVSVNDALKNVGLDRDLSAPRTDQYTIGFDHELASNTAVSASYVYKYGENHIGWKDTGGVYGSSDVMLPDGRVLTTLPLLNDPSARVFVRTNQPLYFNRYHGLVLTFTRRLADRWQLNVGYTASKADGFNPAGVLNPGVTPLGSIGQDPNDLINVIGRLNPEDRPHAVRIQTSYEVPQIGVQLAAALQDTSGLAIAPQAVVPLPQGTRAINIEPPTGEYRFDRQHLLDVRLSKPFRFRGSTLELIGEVRNILQNKANQEVITRTFASPNFMVPSSWVNSRQMIFAARLQF